MIGTDLATAFNFFLIMMLLVGVLAIAFDVWRYYQHKWKISADRLLRCNDCDYMFITRGHNAVLRCPRCDKVCRNTTNFRKL